MRGLGGVGNFVGDELPNVYADLDAKLDLLTSPKITPKMAPQKAPQAPPVESAKEPPSIRPMSAEQMM